MLMQHNLHLLGMVAASILAVAPTDAFAQAKVGEQTPVTVNVTTAGTLNTLVTSDQKFTTTSLVVKGDLNGADILFGNLNDEKLNWFAKLAVDCFIDNLGA